MQLNTAVLCVTAHVIVVVISYGGSLRFRNVAVMMWIVKRRFQNSFQTNSNRLSTESSSIFVRL